MFKNIYSDDYGYCFEDANYNNYYLVINGTGTLTINHLFLNNTNDINSIYLYIGADYDDIDYADYVSSTQTSTIFNNLQGIIDKLEFKCTNIASLIYSTPTIIKNVILNIDVNNNPHMANADNKFVDFDTFTIHINFIEDLGSNTTYIWIPSFIITSFGSYSSNKVINIWIDIADQSSSKWFYNINNIISYTNSQNYHFVIGSIYSKITSLTINIHGTYIIRSDSNGGFSNLDDFKGSIETININYYMENKSDAGRLLRGMNEAFAATDDTFHINVKVYNCPQNSPYRSYGNIQVID